MGGLSSRNGQTYVDSLGENREIHLSNYYLTPYFEETRMSRYGILVTGLLFVIVIIMIQGALP